MADPTTMREMGAEITAALAKMGLGGQVVVRDGAAELHGAPGSDVVAIDLGEWLEQWALLPPEIRARRAEALAQRLRNAAAGTGSMAPQRPSKPLPLGAMAGGALVLVLAAVVFGWLRMSGFFGVSEEPVAEPLASAAGAPASATAAPSARIERTCEAARSRMRAGATIGVDIDGWVVELWLARDAAGRAPLAEHPALKAALAGGAASAVTPPQPHRLNLVKPNNKIGVDQTLVSYGGGFVTRFFSADGRQALLAHARALAQASGAEYAALYARCEHLPHRDVGAWYRGRDANAAAVALLYAAGAFAEPAAYDVTKINARGMPLDTLTQALSGARIDSAEEVRMLGGRVADEGRDFSFALGGPSLANKASRTLATKLKL